MVNLRELAETDLLDIEAQVLYSSITTDPDTFVQIITNKPVVSVRRSSLDQIPVAGDRAFFQIPKTPSRTAEKESYSIDPDRPPMHNESIGFTRYFLHKAIQS
jgi:hypothetical protein